MLPTPRSSSKIVVRLFIALCVAFASIGTGVSAAADPADFDLVADYTTSIANLDGSCGENATVSTITLTPQDADGNLVDPGMGVEFRVPADSPLVFLTDTTVTAPDADGAYTVEVTSAVPGVFDVIGSLADGSHATTVRLPIGNGPLDPDQSGATVSPGTRAADNNDAYMVTITLMGQCGVPIDLSMASPDALTLSAVDSTSGVPVSVARPPTDPSLVGLLLIGYFQVSPGVYNALLVSNRAGTYDVTLTYTEQSSYGTLGTGQSLDPLEVQFVSIDPTGVLSVDPGTTIATANVVRQGAPAAGVDVSFQIDGDAQFDTGGTTVIVTTDSMGQALAPITAISDGCDSAEFDVSAYILGDDSMTPLDGSPIHVSAAPPPGGCRTVLTVSVAPTGDNAYANGEDSWAGTITATLSNGRLVTDTFTIEIYNVVGHDLDGHPIESFTGDVAVSQVTNNGDGTYTVAFTTTVPGTYVATVEWGDARADSDPMTFDPVVVPPPDPPIPPVPPVPLVPPTPVKQCWLVSVLKAYWKVQLIRWLF